MTNTSHDLQQSAVEQALLGAIAGDPSRLSRVREVFEPDDFVVWSSAYLFIIEHDQRFNTPPTPETLKQRFVDWNPPPGEFEYWLDEMWRYTLSRKAQAAILSHYENIESDPEGSVRQLAQELSNLRSHASAHVSFTNLTIDSRVSEFEERVSRGMGFQGIRTGLEPFDNSGMGWMPGELIGILARPAVGKTWLLSREGVISFFENLSVLHVSPEMTVDQAEKRVDVIKAGYLGIPLSLKAIGSGEAAAINLYRQLSEEIAKEAGQYITVDSEEGEQMTVSSIERLCQQYNPDLVLIDGISFLKDEGRAESMWEQMKSLTSGLKSLAVKRRIPIMVAHWAKNTAGGRRRDVMDATSGRGDDYSMPSLNDAAFGDSFVGICDTIIAMAPDRDSRYLTWYSIRKTRNREIEPYEPRFPLGWNVDRGVILDYSRFGSDPQWDDLFDEFRKATGIDARPGQ